MSQWTTRADSASDLHGVPHDTTLVLVGDAEGADPADIAVRDLHALGYSDVRRLQGGVHRMA